MKYIDLTQPIKKSMPVYPGDSAVSLEQDKFFEKDGYNNHRLATGMHMGTHIDGRMHMLNVSEYIGSLPIEHFCGLGCLIHTQDEKIIRMKSAYKDIIRDNEVVLFKTGMDRYYGEDKYYSDHPVLDMSVCEYLAESKVRLIGIDAPSPDHYPFTIHKALLQSNILIIENMTNLDKISSDDKFEVFSFPLRINADSSPVRAVARIINSY